MKSFFCFTLVLIASLCLPMISTTTHDADEIADVVRGRRFELVDEHDRVRIQMSMEEGNPVLKLIDEKGNDRVAVFDQPDATGIYLKDPQGHTRVGLAQFPHGGGLAMHGPDGKGSAVYVLINEKARVDIYNNEGKLTNRWPPEPSADSATPKPGEHLIGHWMHSREEDKGDGIFVYRPKGSREFPPSRFRMQYVFGKDGKCNWLYLSPSDGHHLRDGKWKIGGKSKDVMQITQGETTVSFQIVESTKDVLRLKFVE